MRKKRRSCRHGDFDPAQSVIYVSREENNQDLREERQSSKAIASILWQYWKEGCDEDSTIVVVS